MKVLLNWPQFLWLVQRDQSNMCFLCYAQINFWHIKAFCFVHKPVTGTILSSQKENITPLSSHETQHKQVEYDCPVVDSKSLRAERWGFPLATRSISSCYFYNQQKVNRPLALRGHMTNASFKQWVGILLIPKIDRAHKNKYYLTPALWKETCLRQVFYGTFIF